MDTLLAFRMGELNRGKERMVFDWDKAAKLIVEKRPEIAVAGLDQDLEYTADVIFDQRNIMTDARPYLASTWATPVLILDDVSYDCYKMESEVPEWDEHTVWPDSAKDIMAKGVKKTHYLILDKAGYKEGENWIENMTWFSNYPICNSIESAYKKIIDTISDQFFSGGFDEFIRIPEDELPKLEEIKKHFSEYGHIGAPYDWAYEYKDPDYDNSTGMVGFQIWQVEVEE